MLVKRPQLLAIDMSRKRRSEVMDREQDTDGGKDTHAYVPTSKESRAKEHKADDSEKPRTHVVCLFEDE